MVTGKTQKGKVMKYIFLAVGILAATVGVQASDEKYGDKVATLDATIETLYSVISGDKGVERDWDLFRYLFKPGAHLIPAGKGQNGIVDLQVLTPDGFIDRSGAFFLANGFHEQEIGRTTEQYGVITHVFSTYDSKRTLADEKPFARGINSIQLLNDGKRWWIVNVYWMGETEEFPLPDRYLD